MTLLHLVQHVAWSYHSGSFLQAAEDASAARKLLLATGAGLLIGISVPWIRKGGHAGEISEDIWFNSGRAKPLPSAARSVLSIVIVGLGASLGREGAAKHAGAACASVIGNRLGFSPPELRLLVACGAGAGMAAVYNVPFGGALFAAEVLLGSLALPLVLPALLCSAIATTVALLMLTGGPTYRIPEFTLSLPLLVYSVVASPLIGFVSALYIRIIGWADRLKPKNDAVRLVVSLAVFMSFGTVSIWFPQILGNGKDVVQQSFLSSLSLPLLLWLLLLKPLATAACLGSGAPGGLFTPTFALGAVLGGVLGGAWTLLWPGSDIGVYSLVAATATLAAATRGPISAIVLASELTYALNPVMLPAIICAFGATAVAQRFDPRSIYSARVHEAMALSEHGPRVSEARRYTSVVLRLSRLGPRALVDVTNKTGDVIGTLSESDLRRKPPRPLQTATAADLLHAASDQKGGQ